MKRIGTIDCIETREHSTFSIDFVNKQEANGWVTGNILHPDLRIVDGQVCGGDGVVGSQCGAGIAIQITTKVAMTITATATGTMGLYPVFASSRSLLQLQVGSDQVSRPGGFGDNCDFEDATLTVSGTFAAGDVVTLACLLSRVGDMTEEVGHNDHVVVTWEFTPGPFATDVVNGYRAACFVPDPNPVLDRHDLWDKDELAFHASVIATIESDFAGAQAMVNAWAGAPLQLTGIPVDADLGSGLLIAQYPTMTFLWLVGTTTSAQLLLQATQMQLGPSAFGAFGSVPLWQAAANRVVAAMNAAGVSPTNRCVLYGHSAGGAIATIVARTINQYQLPGKLELATFGMPKPGDQRLKDQMLLIPQINVQNDGDPVPFLAPSEAELGWITAALVLRFVALTSFFKGPHHTWGLYDNGTFLEGEKLTPLLTDLFLIMAAWQLNLPEPIPFPHDAAEYARRLALPAP